MGLVHGLDCGEETYAVGTIGRRYGGWATPVFPTVSSLL